MYLADDWKDFRVIDAGDGEKLEQWGKYRLLRPDPQAIWRFRSDKNRNTADAHYHRSDKGGGYWENKNNIPEEWTVSWNELKFRIKLMGFKHTGLFPEQAVNWKWMMELIRKSGRQINVLNLFAYTGAATAACTLAGATVCHVDASKGMVAQAKENLALSSLTDRPARFIVDDCLKFVLREERRGHVYDAIIMDPPSYGRGPNGEIWKLENELIRLVEACAKILSPHPLFFMINSYTTGLQSSVLKNILEDVLVRRIGGSAEADEVGLPIENGLVLPCGATGRWTAKE